MGALQKIFRKHLPAGPAEKDQVGDTLARLKGVNELLADVVEATKDLDVVEALAKASPWAEALGKSLSDALPPVRFVLKLFEELTKVEDPGELGYLAATLAYQRAVEEALPEVLKSEAGQRIGSVDPEVRKTAIRDLREAVQADLYDFSRFSFDRALGTSFIQDADRFLEVSAHGLGFDDSAFRILQHEVHRRFVSNLKGILSHGSTRERFAPFRELMALDTLEARAHDALLEHADFQRWLFEEQPVLGREPFTLAQVYTETDCGVLRWKEIQNKGQRAEGGGPIDPFKEEHGGRHPLVETVLTLIADPKFRDAIVLQGVAGSGKSSLTLRLARELFQQGLMPIRIELKHLLYSEESKLIKDALPAAVHITSRERTPGATHLTFGNDLFLGGVIFNNEPPVPFRGTKMCRYVLILDGWDEITVGASEGYQQRVERMLEGIRTSFLEQRAFPVRVILTGRPTQAIRKSTFLRGDTCILTVRDFLPEQLESYVARVKAAIAEARKEGRASWSLENVKNLPDVLTRYRKARQEASTGEVAPNSNDRLEILGLPLLAYLALRLLAERPNAAEQMLENTTILYRNLVDHVVGQAGKPVEARGDIEGRVFLIGNDLRQLLRDTAESMTTLGVEALPHDELASRLNTKDGELSRIVDSISIEGDENKQSGPSLLSLIISFFFKDGRTELGAEFSHKSFREYLFAEQVVEHLKAYGRRHKEQLVERKDDDYWRDFDREDPRRDLCRRLAFLLGPVWITPEVAKHLRRLLIWEIGRAVKSETDQVADPISPLSQEQWNRVRDGLADAWDWWGEGVHLRPQPAQDEKGHWAYRDGCQPVAVQVVEAKQLRSNRTKRPVPARTTSVDAHLGDGLFLLTAVVHAELALQGEKPEGVWTKGGQYAGSPRRYQRLLVRGKEGMVMFAPSGPEDNYFFNYCARINAGGYRPLGPFPMDVDLRVAYLREVSLAGVILREGLLSGADFSRAHLHGANLIEANLQGANLREAKLFRVDLRGADLRKANLEEADLNKADLFEARLNEANLNMAAIDPDELMRARRYE